mmetsp:Transcript_23241/g.34307  ORF Transcript_23241/g.34307 Transcript_23241/m.34307 type:complete len:905 (+) Transcript_23241:675-3389(+)
MYEAPTNLHSVCHDAKEANTLTLFLREPNVRGRDLSSAAEKKDKKGKIPLHLLSENHALASSLFLPAEEQCDGLDQNVIQKMSSFALEASNDKKMNKFFFEALLSANPLGIIWKDDDGFIPFEKSLIEWTNRLQRHHGHDSRRSLRSLSSRRKSCAAKRLQNAWTTTSISVGTALSRAGQSLHILSNRDNDGTSEMMENGTKDIGRNEDAIIFPASIRLTSLVRFSIKMLSLIIDQLTSSSSKTKFRFKPKEYTMDSFRSFCNSDTAEDFADHIVEKIAQVPNLILTVFLLDDSAERDWVLNSSIFRLISIHHLSVGSWINATLQNPEKAIAERGLHFLKYVSATIETSEQAAIGNLHDNMLEAVSRLEGFIPSLLSLEERQIEEAATTFIVRSVLNKMISKPFAVCVVFVDFFFLCVLMIGFRCSVNLFLTGAESGTILNWIYVANTGIFYFIIRELGKCITLLERTRRAKVYLWSFWNITDILSTALALCSTISLRLKFLQDVDFDGIESLRALLAVTTGLLWLRALSLLKSLNIQLATFVLAIIQICKDIIWFLIIIGSLVVCFSQMFYTILLPSSCAVNDKDAMDDPQCSQAEYYLRVYTILGDLGFDRFEREEFDTFFSIFLFVLFSFMVVVILLNVLIAIVSDSYEKCLVRSHYLFGRARVLLVAELVSFQNLLRTHPELKADSSEAGKRFFFSALWNRGWSRASITFFCLSALVIFVWLVGEIAGFASNEQQTGSFAYSFLSIVVNVLVFAAIVVVLSNGAAGLEEVKSEEREGDKRRRWISKCYNQLQKFMTGLLGSPQAAASFFRKGETEDWRGRVHYLKNEVKRIVEEENGLIANQIKLVEQTVTVSETHLRSQINSIEEGLSELRADIALNLINAEKKNLALIQQVLDAVNTY